MTAKISDLRHSINEELPMTQFVGGFPKEQLSIIASAPGTGKTWFVLKHALDLSIGGDCFCGFAQDQKPAKAVIMCGEGGFRMLTERRALINQDYNPDNIAIYTLTDLAEAGIETSLDKKDGIDLLAKIIKGEGADICYIDSLIAFRDENENEQQSTSRILKNLITIARKCNCAIIATHHTRKRKRGDNGAATQDDIIGSSAITRLCAMAWTMTHEEDQSFTSLRCVKSWYAQQETIYWRLIQRKDGTIRFDRATGENISVQRERALKFLVNQPAGTYTIDTIMDKCYVDAQAAEAAIRQMCEGPYGELTKVNGMLAVTTN